MELLDKVLKLILKLTPIGRNQKPAKANRLMMILNCRRYLAARGSSPFGPNTEIAKRASAMARKEELITAGVVDGWIAKRNRVHKGTGSHKWIHPATPMPK